MINLMNAPTPGASLTQDPTARRPWEMPPKFTTVNQAADHLFRTVTTKGFIKNYDMLLKEDKKFYIDEIAANMLSEGFMNGLWTVDAMMLLVEPLITMLVWTASQLDRSPTFSTDTGFEQRTGFETYDELISEVTEDVPEVSQEIPEVETPEEPMPAPVEGGML